MILVKENYFSKEANEKYASNSQIKTFDECEARAMAEIKGEWVREKTTSLLVGSYVDAHFSNELDLFKAQNSELFKKDGGLKSDYVQAENIINRIERDKVMMKYLAGATQSIMTGELEGVPIKIKLDSYHEGKAIADLKVVKDFAPIWNDAKKIKENFIDYWSYTSQAALYQEIVRQNTGLQLPFFIVAATKEKETDILVAGITQDVLDEKLAAIKSKLPHIKELKEYKADATRCEKCDYCKFTKVLTGIIDYRDLTL